jgi:hypothetical protein
VSFILGTTHPKFFSTKRRAGKNIMALPGHKPLRGGGVDLLAIVVVGKVVLSSDQWRDDSQPGVKGPASNYVGLRTQPNKEGLESAGIRPEPTHSPSRYRSV